MLKFHLQAEISPVLPCDLHAFGEKLLEEDHTERTRKTCCSLPLPFLECKFNKPSSLKAHTQLFTFIQGIPETLLPVMLIDSILVIFFEINIS